MASSGEAFTTESAAADGYHQKGEAFPELLSLLDRPGSSWWRAAAVVIAAVCSSMGGTARASTVSALYEAPRAVDSEGVASRICLSKPNGDAFCREHGWTFLEGGALPAMWGTSRNGDAWCQAQGHPGMQGFLMTCDLLTQSPNTHLYPYKRKWRCLLSAGRFRGDA